MLIRNNLVLGLLASAAILATSPAHAAEAAMKDPATGKDCVIFFSAERTSAGQTRMNYRNTCASAFTIRIQADDKVRQKVIEAGSPDKPSRAYVTCTVDDRCENARWVYE